MNPVPPYLVRLGLPAYAFWAVNGLTNQTPSPYAWAGFILLHFLGGLLDDWLTQLGTDDSRWRRSVIAVGVGVGVMLLPVWMARWQERVLVVILSWILVWLVGLAVRLTRTDSADRNAELIRLLLLALIVSVTLAPYLTANIVGPKDARWYGYVATDYITQLRAGKFPVLAGETDFMFNGAVHPYRTAPWLLLFSALIDWISLRVFQPIALQHITLIASFSAATGLCYMALVRLNPRYRWTAWAFAVCYSLCPAVTMPLVRHDMYMTVVAAPVLITACYFTARYLAEPSMRATLRLGIALAALWLCHPPVALLGTCAIGGILLWNLLVHGHRFSFQELAIAVAGIGLWVLLVAPYFYAISELPRPVGDVVGRLLLPALGWLCLAVVLLRQAQIRLWGAAVIAVGICLIANHQLALLPMASCVLGSVFLADWLRSRGWARPRTTILMVIMITATAFLLAWLLPEFSQPGRHLVESSIAPASLDLERLIYPIRFGGDSQPGYLVWFLTLTGILLAYACRHRFARPALAGGLLLIMLLAPVPVLRVFVWSNIPEEISRVISVAYYLRLIPVAVPLLLFAVYVLVGETDLAATRWKNPFYGLIALLLLWSVLEHAIILRNAWDYRTSASATAKDLRPENVVLQRYSWDFLPIPPYFSNGYMDPALESRFWKYGDQQRPLIDPDRIAAAMEKEGGQDFGLLATQDPTYPRWLYFDHKIRLRPGQKKLLRFDFLGRKIQGWLILRSAGIYREYMLPESGLERAFGCGATNSRTLSLSNTGAQTEEVELVLLREGAGEAEPPPAGPYAHLVVSDFHPDSAPIEIISLSPLLLRVRAAEAGMLETFKSFAPGYRILVDGQPVTGRRSRNHLLSLPISPGTHEVFIRFRGTPALRAWFWFGVVAWSLAMLFLLIDLVRRSGIPSPRPMPSLP